MSGQVRIGAASTTNGWCMFDVVTKLTRDAPSDTNDTPKRLKRLDKQVRIMVRILLHALLLRLSLVVSIYGLNPVEWRRF